MKTNEFLDILCEALRVERGSLSVKDSPETVANWDSLGHMSIIAAIESNFGLDVSEHESLRRFRSLGEIVETLKGFGVLKD
jgi:acyl carrier protein